MKTWQKIVIPLLVASLVAGIYLFFVFKARRDSDKALSKPAEEKPISADDLAYLKQYLFATFDQAKQLEGMTVWVKAGYSLPYYPYTGGQVEFSKRVGELPSAQELHISRLIKAVVPAKEDDRVQHGTRQYFAVFTLAGPDAKPGTFAAPIGFQKGDQEQILSDLLFYYDDPKKIYSNWAASVWDAVAAHEPKPGMTENQVRMALGIVMQSDSQEIGNRTVTYQAGPKTWTVTFSNGVATQVKQG
jgi:hypothetical protein